MAEQEDAQKAFYASNSRHGNPIPFFAFSHSYTNLKLHNHSLSTLFSENNGDTELEDREYEITWFMVTNSANKQLWYEVQVTVGD